MRLREGGNVFDITVGVGITICVRNSQDAERFIKYHRVLKASRKLERLELLKVSGDMAGLEWQTLTPNARNNWLTEGIDEDFDAFLPLGTKSAKASFSPDIETVFRRYSNGVKTNRDEVVYDFERAKLADGVKGFIEIYNSEVARWQASDRKTPVDDFVDYSGMKWSRDLKLDLKRGHKAVFDEANIRPALYRPFCKQWLYFDRILNEEVYALPKAFPRLDSENRVIVVSDLAHRSPFSALMTDCIPDLHLCASSDGFQCFPLYTYSPDGAERTENITAHALAGFRAAYGEAVSKEDIFHFVYALLHHPTYRAKYAENLKRDLPRVPLWPLPFARVAEIGRELGDLHVGFESAPFHEPLRPRDTRDKAMKERGDKLSYRVEKMKWNADKTSLVLNPTLALDGFSPDLFAYKLGNRSALDWLVESLRVKTDARSGLASDPNRQGDPRYLLDLIRRVAHVAHRTDALVAELVEFPNS